MTSAIFHDKPVFIPFSSLSFPLPSPFPQIEDRLCNSTGSLGVACSLHPLHYTDILWHVVEATVFPRILPHRPLRQFAAAERDKKTPSRQSTDCATTRTSVSLNKTLDPFLTASIGGFSFGAITFFSGTTASLLASPPADSSLALPEDRKEESQNSEHSRPADFCM